MSLTTISPHDLYEQLQVDPNLEVIDVRTPVEFRELHIAGARNVPLDQLNAAALAARPNAADRPLYVVCRTGHRARQACEKLLGAGTGRVVNVDGGTLAWADAGLPVVRGKAAISLERQVRIAAGLLVLIGAALGFFVHPYWMGLAAFVGAGLAFAGIADSCAMGMLLARMPWNQVKDGNDAPSAAGISAQQTTNCCSGG